MYMNYANDTIFDIILYYNLSYDELWLVKVCSHMAHKYTFTNQNSSCSELWHKIVSLA